MKSVLFPLILVFSYSASAEIFSVSTWNIHGASKLSKIEKELEKAPVGLSDILCLQEAHPDKNQAEYFAKKLNYNYFFLDSNAILTRFPILQAGEVIINQKNFRRAPWVVLQVSSEVQLKVYSPHLSYKIGSNPFVGSVRGQEMKAILDDAANHSGPVIIAGDFNTVGYFIGGYKKEPAIKFAKADDFLDALEKVGGKTHKWVGRIDWIFYKDLFFIQAQRGNYGGSDHRWIQAKFQTKTSNEEMLAQWNQ